MMVLSPSVSMLRSSACSRSRQADCAVREVICARNDSANTLLCSCCCANALFFSSNNACVREFCSCSAAIWLVKLLTKGDVRVDITSGRNF
jgi:hypothetical protein